MAVYLKVAEGGYKPVESIEDPECSQVMLSKDEFLYERASCEAVQIEFQTEIDELKKTVRQAKKEAERYQEMNAGLLRICRERANAERGLQPKKERCGYVVLSSEEKTVTFSIGLSKKVQRVLLWETRLQSSYSVNFTEEQARHQIAEDLSLENAELVLDRIGLCGYYQADENDDFSDPSLAVYESNSILTIRLSADFREGYWVAILWHMRPLDTVPQDLRPVRKNRTSEKK